MQIQNPLYLNNIVNFQNAFDRYRKISNIKSAQTVIADFETARKEWVVLSRKIVDGRVADTREGRRLAIDLSLKDAKEKFDEMRRYLDSLTEMNLVYAEKAQKDAHKVFRITLMSLMIVMIMCILIGIVLLVLLLRMLLQ